MDEGSASNLNVWLNFLSTILLAIISGYVTIKLRSMDKKIDTNTSISTKGAAMAAAVGETIANESASITEHNLKARAHAIAVEMAREADNGRSEVFNTYRT